MYIIRQDFLLQNTHTHWCLCLCCHDDATCSLCLCNSEKGESATLPFSSLTLRFAYALFSLIRFPTLSPLFSFYLTFLICFFLSFSDSQDHLKRHLKSISPSHPPVATQRKILRFLYQLCTSFPSLIVFHWGNRSIGHIVYSQLELNFPSSTSCWAEPVLTLWWDKSSRARDEIWQMRKES